MKFTKGFLSEGGIYYNAKLNEIFILKDIKKTALYGISFTKEDARGLHCKVKLTERMCEHLVRLDDFPEELEVEEPLYEVSVDPDLPRYEETIDTDLTRDELIDIIKKETQ